MLNLSSYKNEVRGKFCVVHYKYFTVYVIELYHSLFFSFQREIFFSSYATVYGQRHSDLRKYFSHFWLILTGCAMSYIKGPVPGITARNHSPSAAQQLCSRQSFITLSPVPVLAPGCSFTSVTRLYFRQKPDRKGKHIVGKCGVFYFSFMLRTLVMTSLLRILPTIQTQDFCSACLCNSHTLEQNLIM